MVFNNKIIGKVKEKELENVSKQLENYKKEINELNNRLKDEAESNKITILEQKLNKSIIETDSLHKEIKILENMQKIRGKELSNTIETNEHKKKIKFLNEHLTKLKLRAKDVDNKLKSNTNNNDKFKKYLQTLETTLPKQKIQITIKKNLINKSIEIPKDNSGLIIELELLRNTLSKYKSEHNKEILDITSEIQVLNKLLKNHKKENTINALQFRKLSTVRNKTELKSRNPNTARNTLNTVILL